jgi:hypothetical protein
MLVYNTNMYVHFSRAYVKQQYAAQYDPSKTVRSSKCSSKFGTDTAFLLEYSRRFSRRISFRIIARDLFRTGCLMTLNHWLVVLPM